MHGHLNVIQIMLWNFYFSLEKAPSNGVTHFSDCKYKGHYWVYSKHSSEEESVVID